MLSSSFVDESTILNELATSPVFHEYANLTLIIRSINGDSRTCVSLACYQVCISTSWAICESSTTIEGYECIAVLISTLESDTAIGSATICSPLTLAESRHCLTNLVQTDEVLSHIMIQRGSHITRSLVFTEV